MQDVQKRFEDLVLVIAALLVYVPIQERFGGPGVAVVSVLLALCVVFTASALKIRTFGRVVVKAVIGFFSGAIIGAVVQNTAQPFLFWAMLVILAGIVLVDVRRLWSAVRGSSPSFTGI